MDFRPETRIRIAVEDGRAVGIVSFEPSRIRGRARRFYEREGWRLDGRTREHENWGPMVRYQLRLASGC